MPSARDRRPGLLGTVARTAAISGTAGTTSNIVERRARARWDQGAPTAETALSDTPAADLTAAAPVGGDQLADQLARLAELRISGVLTDDEFAAAKARLLT